MLWRLWQWGETSTHHLVLTFVSDLHLMPVRVASNTDRERVLGARGECELVRKFGASWPTVAHCGPLWPKVINYQCSNQLMYLWQSTESMECMDGPWTDCLLPWPRTVHSRNVRTCSHVRTSPFAANVRTSRPYPRCALLFVGTDDQTISKLLLCK